ncbi:CaiB/BaiF CoA transferase family protein [Silicimonas algicola]|uniref:Formyl-CoA transferase n=1 Tax=Silicimonas algicola TaxID=1826607 RepID=A0A316FV98_9RHOB|nr:CoA transferase [Silicimonas algicola]PWK52714.1 formyl-CoA transferase [Silicimonas algicola]
MNDAIADTEVTPDAAAARATEKALNGIRILDLTQFEAGPSCTQMLGWLGAEIIKIESPGTGEQGRRASTENDEVDSVYFMLLNANKKSVTCNLKSETGKTYIRKLIEKCDVFIENFGPGVIERLGFSYEEVSKINPRIIYAQIKGFDQSGPYAKLLAFDNIAQAAGGSLSVTGDADGRPLTPGVNVGDTGSGLHCSVGILSAIIQRQRTGRGQRIEIIMQEAVINFGRILYAAQAHFGTAVPRRGNAHIMAASAPCEVYPCKGGGPNDYILVYTSRATNRQWESLLKLMGREDLKDEPKYTSPALRYQNSVEIDKIVAAWCVTRDKYTCMRELGEAGVPSGAVIDTMEMYQDPQLRKQGAFVTVDHPVRGEFTLPGCPVRMSDSPIETSAPPLLGADNEEIYGGLLGVSEEDIAAALADKSI